MADKHSSKGRAAGGLFMLLLAILLSFAIYPWYNSGIDLSSDSRHAGVLDFQDMTEHWTNLTVERRQTYQCSADNPCTNGACCGASGYCGYGERSA